MPAGLRPKIEAAIADVDQALAAHQQGDPNAPLSPEGLAQVRVELQQMVAAMDPTAFSPGYARFILDSYSDQELTGRLVELAYWYKKIRKPPA